MKYLSFDIEATGLRESDLVIEFGMLPFCSETRELNHDLAFHCFVKCPSFEELKPNLDPWVIEHNEQLIRKAHSEGLDTESFKNKLETWLSSKEVTSYFGDQKITLFGKSMSAIDLPFLTRDLGWQWMRKHFEHRQLDLSSVALHMIDAGILPKECSSGSFLTQHLGLGTVAHTALEDAINTAVLYIKILDLIDSKK